MSAEVQGLLQMLLCAITVGTLITPVVGFVLTVCGWLSLGPDHRRRSVRPLAVGLASAVFGFVPLLLVIGCALIFQAFIRDDQANPIPALLVTVLIVDACIVWLVFRWRSRLRRPLEATTVDEG